MPLIWDPSYAVGYLTIDQQHQELFARVNALLDAMHARRGKDEIEKLLGFLSTYVVHHFGAEETLMRQHAYAGMAEHVAEHQAFVAELRTFRETFRTSGASTSLVVGVNKRLCGWLVDHVGRMDRQLGGFLSRAA